MAARKPAVTSAPLTIADFHKALDQISHSHSRCENFRLFIEAAYCALARRTALSRARTEALEASYMAIVKRYSREPEAPRRMAELFGRLGLALSCYHGDFLGEAYMTAGFGNKYAGQFFTPYCISSLIARVNVTRECVEEALAAGHPLRLLEPASGAGSMVLAGAEHLQEKGFDLSKCLFATLVDIDPLCVQMGFLQLSFKNVPAACVHGNSLVPVEEYSFAYTIPVRCSGACRSGTFTNCHPKASRSSTRRFSPSGPLHRSRPSLWRRGRHPLQLHWPRLPASAPLVRLPQARSYLPRRSKSNCSSGGARCTAARLQSWRSVRA